MTLRVNMIREPVKAYDKNKFEVDLESFDFKWQVRYTADQLEETKNKLTKKIEDGKDWKPELHEEIFRKLRPIMPKLEPFVLEMIANVDEVVDAIFVKLVEVTGLDKVKLKQKKLEMPKNKPQATASTKN